MVRGQMSLGGRRSLREVMRKALKLLDKGLDQRGTAALKRQGSTLNLPDLIFHQRKEKNPLLSVLQILTVTPANN